jgi:purine-cytosine permease-like protein
MTLSHTLLWGAVGGVLPDAIRLVKERHNEALPPYVKSLNFYVGLVLAVALGAATAALLGAASVQEALACGFGAPEILTRLFSSPGTGPGPARLGAMQTLREWWAL